MVYVYTLLLTCGLISVSIASDALQVWGSAKGLEAIPEDVLLDIKQLGYKNGYHVDDHSVVTEDGYIVHIHRMPESISGHKNGQVVFLMHGILDCSDSWLLLGPEHALAYQLVEEGFDVWMGNARGNKHSSRHISLHSNTPDFWKFSWEEIGLYDLPAMIDYVLNVTHERSLHYIGHSQGTTVGYVMLSMKPEYNKKIKMMFSLAPEAYMGSIQSPIIRMFSPALNFLQSALLQYSQFSSAMEFYNKISPIVCGLLPENCQNIMFAMTGNENKIISSFVPVIFGHMPTGSSALQFIHYGQLVNSKRFCRYDFGHDTNVKMYGRVTPPDFDLSEITTPILMLYSNNDWLSHPRDVNMLNRRLPKVVAKINIGDFTHLDYVYSIQARDAIYKPIIEHMIEYEKYNNEDEIPDCSSPDQGSNNFNGGCCINRAPGCSNNQQPNNSLTNCVQAPPCPNPDVPIEHCAEENQAPHCQYPNHPSIDEHGDGKYDALIWQYPNAPSNNRSKWEHTQGGKYNGPRWPAPNPTDVNHPPQWQYPNAPSNNRSNWEHSQGGKYNGPRWPAPNPTDVNHPPQWQYPKVSSNNRSNWEHSQGGKYNGPRWPAPNPTDVNHPPQWQYPNAPSNNRSKWEHNQGGKDNGPRWPAPNPTDVNHPPQCQYPNAPSNNRSKWEHNQGGKYNGPRWPAPSSTDINHPSQWQYPNAPSNNRSKWEYIQGGKDNSSRWPAPSPTDINHPPQCQYPNGENQPPKWIDPHLENPIDKSLEKSCEKSQQTEHSTIEYNTEKNEDVKPETLLPEYIEVPPEHIHLDEVEGLDDINRRNKTDNPQHSHLEYDKECKPKQPDEAYVLSKRKQKMADWYHQDNWFNVPDVNIDGKYQFTFDVDHIPKWFNPTNIIENFDIAGDVVNLYKSSQIPFLRDPLNKVLGKHGVPPNYINHFHTGINVNKKLPLTIFGDPINTCTNSDDSHKPKIFDMGNDGMTCLIDPSNSIDRNAESYNHINTNTCDKEANSIQELPMPFCNNPLNSLEKHDDPRSHTKNFDYHFYQEPSNPFHVDPHNLFEFRTNANHNAHGCEINGYGDCVE